jgi:hypothetical protein
MILRGQATARASPGPDQEPVRARGAISSDSRVGRGGLARGARLITFLETSTVGQEQDLAAANARIAQLERAEAERTKAAGVAQELRRYDLVSPAAADQLAQMIMPEVEITTAPDGRPLIHGKDYKPLAAIVEERLRSPDHAHFFRPKESPAPASPATPSVSTSATSAVGQTLGAVLGAARAAAPPVETLGQAMVRAAQAQKGIQGDPQLDMSKPFALGRRGLPSG